MGKKLEIRTISEVESTAEALVKAAGRLTAVALQMKRLKMDEIVLYWAQRQWTAFDIVTEMCKDAELMSEAQFTAFQQGRKSVYAATMERTARDTAKKKAKAAPAAKATKKAVGRPRKKG